MNSAEQAALDRHRSPDGMFDPETNTYITGLGERLYHVHDRALCAGEACVIHNPSDHCMRTFPTHWRGDRFIMERICPHGVGHPDPDSKGDGIHGCDGCCVDDHAQVDPPGEGFGAVIGAAGRINLAASKKLA